MSQALYRKWRPTNFEQVVGQQHVTRTLQNSVTAGRVGHAYLFCGPRGTGKTTTARLLAKAVNCREADLVKRPCNMCAQCRAVNEGRFLDLIEIDAASNTGVDDIRDLRDKINFAPNQGRYKVYIIDEVHMLSTAAFNALLKTLEEPPAHAIFVLATTEEHKVPLTIKSRCQQFNFRLLSVEEIKGRLDWLANQENLIVEPEALDILARQGAGSIRDAESLLDQLVIAPGDAITLERAQAVLGTAATEAVVGLTDAWLNANGAEGLGIMHEALVSGADARQFARQIVAHLRQLLLLQAAGDEMTLDVPEEYQAVMLVQAQRAPRRQLIEAVRHFNEAALKPTGSWQPQLPLELAFIELLPDEPAPMPVFTQPAQQESQQPAARKKVPEEMSPKPKPEPVGEVGSKEPVEPEEATQVEQAEEASEPAAATQAAEVQQLSVQAVKAQWQSMVSLISQDNRNLPPLLAMCKPLGIEGSVIILGFEFPILKGKFDRTEGAAHMVGEALSQLLAQHCTVRSVVTGEYSVSDLQEEFEALAQELGGVVTEE